MTPHWLVGPPRWLLVPYTVAGGHVTPAFNAPAPRSAIIVSLPDRSEFNPMDPTSRWASSAQRKSRLPSAFQPLRRSPFSNENPPPRFTSAAFAFISAGDGHWWRHGNQVPMLLRCVAYLRWFIWIANGRAPSLIHTSPFLINFSSVFLYH